MQIKDEEEREMKIYGVEGKQINLDGGYSEKLLTNF
jgi:hypothetical protein